MHEIWTLMTRKKKLKQIYSTYSLSGFVYLSSADRPITKYLNLKLKETTEIYLIAQLPYNLNFVVVCIQPLYMYIDDGMQIYSAKNREHVMPLPCVFFVCFSNLFNYHLFI